MTSHPNDFCNLCADMCSFLDLIFCGFYTVLWITCGIAITVHANNPDNCNLFDDKEEDFGDDYRNAWPTQVKSSEEEADRNVCVCV